MASVEHFELQTELIERGFGWQVATFAVIGGAATSALAIYSETDALSFRFFEVATTKLNWAFIPAVAYVVDWSRKCSREDPTFAQPPGEKLSKKAGARRKKESDLASKPKG